MKTYQLVVHGCVRGIFGAGRRIKCEISQVWGLGALDLGWLGNIYRQRTMSTYNYV
jgi:hypothetical protein